VRVLALKVDVDTWMGTRDGVPRLAELFTSLGCPATFLFSLGPDHTGRAVRRIFRPGFLGKVGRTSVVSNYGIRTLLYGTLLPGPQIGVRARDQMRDVQRGGFEVGVHAYDHVEWQDRVETASETWTRQQMGKACEVFGRVFERAPTIHGSAGWQVNAHVPLLEETFGFRFASDTRGDQPFLPAGGGVPQLPTTLPTLDELIGRQDLRATPVDALLELTRADAEHGHVYTLHAELEGGAYLTDFRRLLLGWREQGYTLASLGDMFTRLDIARLPRRRIMQGTVAGRSGTLACIGDA
jgi:peptidoglycan/xylan/chitin deacetylase (PgdA/CDA1 family)